MIRLFVDDLLHFVYKREFQQNLRMSEFMRTGVLSPAGLIIFPLYLVVILLISWGSRQRWPTSNDYLNASRSLPTWAAALSMLAYNCGSIEVIGMSAMAAQYGVRALHFYWIGGIPGMIFLGIVVLPIYMRTGARSLPEYLGMRFGAKSAPVECMYLYGGHGGLCRGGHLRVGTPQTSGLDAQSAITGGGVMSFNLKSGTNTLHGSAFLYGHNELLDANTWTNDNVGVEKPKERAWDYGFSLGGPIHKDKTFFFGTFERFQSLDFRLNSGGATVPTTAFLNGDFSALLGPTLCSWSGTTDLCSNAANHNNVAGAPLMVQNDAGQPVQAQQGMIYDPATGNQFTGNVIHSNQISPVAQKVNSFYKNYAPNLGGLSNNERTLLSNTPSQTPNEFVVKLDHVLRAQDHLSGSWIYDHKPRTLDDGVGLWQSGTTTGGPLSNARVQQHTQQQYRLSESHTFGPSLLNVVNFTDAFVDNGSASADPGDWNSQVGFGNTSTNTFPEISFSDNSNSAVSETYLGDVWQGDVSGATITTGDTLTWTKGRHNLSFGGDFIAHQVDSRSGSGAYSFKFAYNPTSCGSQWQCAGAGYDGFAFATYELGMVNSATETVAYNLYGRQKEIALFAQDSYRMTPKLTVNLGLRWNYNTRFHEKYGNWANFDPTVVDPQLVADYGANLPGSLVFAKGGGDSFEKNEYAANVGPTLGIAYQLNPKLVAHISYGLIYNPVGVTFFNGVPDQFAPQLGSSAASNFSWDAPGGGGNYPGVLSKATLATDPSTMSPFPVEVDPRALRLGYSEQFNVGVQQQLTPNTRLEIAYVGNRGHRLTDTALAPRFAQMGQAARLENKR
jgi:hypothetical protein